MHPENSLGNRGRAAKDFAEINSQNARGCQIYLASTLPFASVANCSVQPGAGAVCNQGLAHDYPNRKADARTQKSPCTNEGCC
jgi:hypothetical protein